MFSYNFYTDFNTVGGGSGGGDGGNGSSLPLYCCINFIRFQSGQVLLYATLMIIFALNFVFRIYAMR